MCWMSKQWKCSHLGLLVLQCCLHYKCVHSVSLCAACIPPLLFPTVPLQPHHPALNTPPNVHRHHGAEFHAVSTSCLWWWRSLHNRDFGPMTCLCGNPRRHIGFQQDVWRGAAPEVRCRETGGRQRRRFQDVSPRSHWRHACANTGPFSKTHLEPAFH